MPWRQFPHPPDGKRAKQRKRPFPGNSRLRIPAGPIPLLIKEQSRWETPVSAIRLVTQLLERCQSVRVEFECRLTCRADITAKHILNSPATLVLDSLKGLVALNPHVGLDEAQRGEQGFLW